MDTAVSGESVGVELDDDGRYRAVSSRDRRFDGWFVLAVTSTRIYCRPSCPATTPRRANVRFYRTAAAAQCAGFRACKRCRPDASPGSPEWNVRGDVVARAMRLIGDGVVDRDGVGGLARRLGYSERHLVRIVSAELGAGPLAIARAQRAHTARLLIETTDMSITDVAFAAGFGSVRQFNDTVREVFAAAPSELRTRGAGILRSAAGERTVEAGSVTLRLAVREPFDAAGVLGFLGVRAVPGVEEWDGITYTRSLALPHGQAVVSLTPADGAVMAALRLADWRDIAPAVARCRRLLDLDADPAAIDGALAADGVLASLVECRPGLRSPGCVDGGEIAVRAVLGQQVSVAGARTIAGRLTAALGEPLTGALRREGSTIDRVFPTCAALAGIDTDLLPMPAARRRTLVEICSAVASGALVIDPGVDRVDLTARLSALPGIGPWTASYIAMRGVGDPDVFLPTDLGVRHALERLGLDATPRAATTHAAAWRPWRSYALHHLWASLAPTDRTNP
jgi:AraC family transcriptional regulator of adaptative response / DNA-3-methyladenine glycosylase II